TSEPYAVISLGRQKRFSPMVPSQRNPVWGEAFSFLARELPAEVIITVYDWDNVCKRKVIGSVTVAILAEDETGAVWYDLDSRSGQVGYAFMNNNQPSSSQCFITVATACTIPLTTQVSGCRSACVLAQRKCRRLLTGNVDLRNMNSIICEGRQTSFLFHQMFPASLSSILEPSPRERSYSLGNGWQ
uniref:C2 domain-containing protein n=1 Tax=Aegilops tauschii subsp. strangulata TaxID=200361 RepID=A0A453P1Y4_AEGTS